MISGLKYLQVVKRKGIKGERQVENVASVFMIPVLIVYAVDKIEEMVGSYGPSAEIYEKKVGLGLLCICQYILNANRNPTKFPVEDAPSGMIARGHYEAKSKFVDDDGHCHLEWDWVS